MMSEKFDAHGCVSSPFDPRGGTATSAFAEGAGILEIKGIWTLLKDSISSTEEIGMRSGHFNSGVLDNKGSLTDRTSKSPPDGDQKNRKVHHRIGPALVGLEARSFWWDLSR